MGEGLCKTARCGVVVAPGGGAAVTEGKRSRHRWLRGSPEVGAGALAAGATPEDHERGADEDQRAGPSDQR